MAKHTSGVEERPTSLRLNFSLNGKMQKVPLKLPPTPKNIKYATDLVAKIRIAIAKGEFSWEEYLPDSAQAKALAQARSVEAVAEKNFGEWCASYLKTKGQLASNSLEQYHNALEVWKEMLGAESSIKSLTHDLIAEVVGGTKWASPNLLNNYLIPLRGTFDLAVRIIKIDNPMKGIKNSKRPPIAPDPLTHDEQEDVLRSMKEHYDVRAWAYFEFAFLTGMRPEEIIELRWGDVDFRSQTIKVARARTSGEIKATKTYSIRDVDLVKRAIAALETMKPWTFVGGTTKEDQRYGRNIFQNPVTGQPWHDERSQRDTFWRPTLARLGLRWRRAYQTRHTFATVALAAGVNPSYVSRQMGHANPKMLFTVYSKWIDGADRGREKQKREDMLEKAAMDAITTHQLPTSSQR